MGFKDKDGKYRPTENNNTKGKVSSGSGKDTKNNNIDKTNAGKILDDKMKLKNPKINGKVKKSILIGRDENDMAVELTLDVDRDNFSLTGTEWDVADTYTEKEGEERARERIRDDLENEPYVFSPDFIADHVDMDNLQSQLESDVYDMNMERVNEEDDDLPDDEKLTDAQMESKAQEMTDDDLRDPMEYLPGIYGKGEVNAEAIRIGGINIDEAIDDAIAIDGWEHYMGDVTHIGKGKHAEIRSGGQIDMHNKFNMKKSIIANDDLQTVKKAWTELHLKSFESMNASQSKLAKEVIDIFENHKEFDEEDIGDLV